ncbi:MAG: sulfatase-like hydrolase/transferase, partial [Verrucomicrobiota bacterium]
GKWGLGPVGSSGDPNAQGFDVFFGYNCQAHAHSYYPATLWRNDEIVALDNDPPVPGHASLADGADPADPASYAEFQGTDYASDRIHEALQAFLKEEPEKPFFLYYPSLIPHVALHVPDEDLKPYLAEGWQDPPFSRARGYGYTPHFTPRAAYAAMITRLDTYVGRILDTLEELGKAENTLVIFTSDNGTTHLKDEVDYDFFASVGKLRGLKGSVFEGGLRVPLIVRWPGKVKAGTVSEVVTGFEDWMPTLGEMGGETTPGGGEGEGISILPALLRGEGVERSFLYREFQGYGGQQALWRGPWKAVRQGLAGKRKDGSLPEVKTELYHLVEDPSEERDVAEEQAALVSELEGLMAAARVPSEAFPIPVLDSN